MKGVFVLVEGVGASELEARKLPPLAPDWLERILTADYTEVPSSRGVGPAGPLSTLRAQVARARARQDKREERAACWSLANHLASHGYDFQAAVLAAQRVLDLEDDVSNRIELAGWLEGMGDFSTAASVLHPCVPQASSPQDSARLLVRIARLLSLAGDWEPALQTLLSAAQVLPESGKVLELAAEVGTRLEGTDPCNMLLEAASRHEENGEVRRAFEARRRAFGLAPQDERACGALVQSLLDGGREAAADEILRSHAMASDAPRAVAVHVRRLVGALERDDLPRAIAAVLDGGLDGESGGQEAAVDDALERAGLLEIRAARCEIEASRLEGAQRAALFVKLARLYSTQLGSPDRAIEAWIEALGSDATCEEAREALRTQARTMHDQTVLAEGLSRAARSAEEPELRLDYLRELAVIAEERLAEPSLAMWAVNQMMELVPDDPELTDAANRLSPRVRLQDAALSAAQNTARRAQDEERLEPLRRTAFILRGRPLDLEEYLEVLAELVELAPTERRWWIDFQRAARHAGRDDLVERSMRRCVEEEPALPELAHLRTSLVTVAIRRDDRRAALEDARRFARELRGLRSLPAFVWVLATELDDSEARSEALELMAPNLITSVRATLLAISGQIRAALGQSQEAHRLAELAKRTDSSEPRVLSFLANLAVLVDEPLPNDVPEKAWSVVLPRARHHEVLVNGFEAAQDYGLAFAWTRRWCELRPWDETVLARLVSSAVMTERVDLIVETIERVLNSPLTLDELTPIIEGGLRGVVDNDVHQAIGLARKILGRTGARDSRLRAVFLDIADRSKDARFEVAVLERWLLGDEAEQNPDGLLRLADRYHELGDAEGEAIALLRAASVGAELAEVLSRIDRPHVQASGDAPLIRSEARAASLSRAGEDRAEEAASVWREIGAARWEVARDTMGAVAAWRHAANLDHTSLDRLAVELSVLAGDDGATAALLEYATSLGDESESARILLISAGLALRSGQPELALLRGTQALKQDPRRTDALLVVERATDEVGDAVALEAAYELAARTSKGRFGRRAAHYRAARQLRGMGEAERALAHATAAFEADPVDGSALALATELTVGGADPGVLVSALIRVADATSNDEVRAAWLMRASHLASRSEETIRLALNLALRALLLSPDVSVAELLRLVMDQILRAFPEDRDLLELRAEHAAEAISPKLEGPHGARLALVMARLSIETLHSSALAVRWTEVALNCSGDIDEYESLNPLATAIAQQNEPVMRWIDAVVARADGTGGTTGPALFGLAAEFAEALGDEERAAAVKRSSEAAARRESAPADDFFADLADDDEEPPLLDSIPAKAAELEEVDREWGDESEDEYAGKETGTKKGIPKPPEPPVEATAEPTTSRGLAPVPQAAEPPESMDALERAAQLEEVGQIAEAIRVVELEVSRNSERSEELDPHLRRLYAAAGRNTQLGLVLNRLAERASDSEEKVGLHMELLGLSEARGDVAGVRENWRRIAELDPSHTEAAAFLEKDAAERGDYEALLELLERRASSSVDPEEIRSLRLRQAMLAERQLDRPEEACRTLDRLLEAIGEDPPTLRARAEAAERAGDRLGSAIYWTRGARVAASRTEAAELACKGARVYLDSEEEEAARRAIGLVGDVRSPEVLSVLVELERRAGNNHVLGVVLDELATAADVDASQRSRWLIEAAEAAIAAERWGMGLERADRAEGLSPNDQWVRLRRMLIRFRAEGVGDPKKAAILLSSLESLDEEIEGEDVPLYAYLTSKVTAVTQGAEAAMEVLAHHQRQSGLAPLIALAMADQLMALGNAQAALPLYDEALRGSGWQNVRERGEVLCAAGRAALLVGGAARTAPYLSELERESGGRRWEETLRKEVAEFIPDTDEMRRQLDRLVRETAGAERAEALLGLARMSAGRGTRAANAEGDRFYAEALSALAGHSDLQREIEEERAALRSRMTPSQFPPAESTRRPIGVATAPAMPAPPAAGVATNGTPRAEGEAPLLAPALPAAEVSGDSEGAHPVSTPVPPSRAPSSGTYAFVSSHAPSMAHPPVTDAPKEQELFNRLAAGEAEAGDDLAEMLGRDPSRSHDLVAIRRRQVVLAPSDIQRLEHLKDAAWLDRNRPQARAVEHVLAVLTGGERVLAPPLSSQRDEPERVLSMVFRGVYAPATEVFEILWEHASHLFSRDAAYYGITGLQRVTAGAPSSIGRAYAAAARALGLARVPVFQRRSTIPMSMAIALMTPPAVLVSGEVPEDSPELLYRMGSMLTATRPHNALLFGLPASEAQTLFTGMIAAFGPPDRSRGRESETAVLAGKLWQALPPRAQRRLHEVFRDADAHTYDSAWGRALQSTRRAGLFVVGNLETALRDAINDPGMEGLNPTASHAFRTLCAASPSAADLVRFGTSAEYAEARWREPGPQRLRSSP